jgi:hypothetical protein
MVEVSTSVFSSVIAVVWRRVCGVTFLDASVGPAAAVVGTYFDRADRPCRAPNPNAWYRRSDCWYADFEACSGGYISDLGEERRHRVVRVRSKSGA